MKLEDFENLYQPKPCKQSSKHHRPDTILRAGRTFRKTKQHVGNSSMAPRKDHTSKGSTLRSFRIGLKEKHDCNLNKIQHRQNNQ